MEMSDTEGLPGSKVMTLQRKVELLAMHHRLRSTAVGAHHFRQMILHLRNR